MSSSTKIQAHHLTRQAVVYIRQSTPKQVQLNQESTRRQYQLADQAHAWGCSDYCCCPSPEAPAQSGWRLALCY